MEKFLLRHGGGGAWGAKRRWPMWTRPTNLSRAEQTAQPTFRLYASNKDFRNRLENTLEERCGSAKQRGIGGRKKLVTRVQKSQAFLHTSHQLFPSADSPLFSRSTSFLQRIFKPVAEILVGCVQPERGLRSLLCSAQVRRPRPHRPPSFSAPSSPASMAEQEFLHRFFRGVEQSAESKRSPPALPPPPRLQGQPVSATWEAAFSPLGPLARRKQAQKPAFVSAPPLGPSQALAPRQERRIRRKTVRFLPAGSRTLHKI